MRLSLLYASILSLALAFGSVWAESTPVPTPVTRHPEFLVTPELRKQIEFWKRIYGEYDTKQSLIHDARYIEVIYDVVTALPGESRAATSRRIRAERTRWRKVLLSLHAKNRSLSSGELSAEMNKPDLTEDERHVLRLMANVSEPNKFLNAAHRRRLRVQLGQKDRFQEGYIASGRYISKMEEIFRSEGLPVELTRLPFVESSFNLKARSKVGASGIWQFMRSTGRLYLKMNGDFDERNDPIRATEAAAKLLKTNFEALGNWPLAVTAYNHGRMGMMRAVRQVNSSRLEDLIANYRSRTFGFASQNFFTCLVAAIEIEREAERYFGPITRDPSLQFFEVELPHPIKTRDLKWYFQWDQARVSTIRELNPALPTRFWEGQYRLPAQYRLRLPLAADKPPEEQVRAFQAGYEEMHQSLNNRKGRRGTVTTRQ
ncbi:MAG: lytic transglycosylase domain-containing protein [Bdellovibrionales bacterium]|nr:lytic transglycosylase domain-containing protein [Bdellovibrionales bacterium]